MPGGLSILSAIPMLRDTKKMPDDSSQLPLTKKEVDQQKETADALVNAVFEFLKKGVQTLLDDNPLRQQGKQDGQKQIHRLSQESDPPQEASLESIIDRLITSFSFPGRLKLAYEQKERFIRLCVDKRERRAWQKEMNPLAEGQGAQQQGQNPDNHPSWIAALFYWLGALVMIAGEVPLIVLVIMGFFQGQSEQLPKNALLINSIKLYAPIVLIAAVFGMGFYVKVFWERLPVIKSQNEPAQSRLFMQKIKQMMQTSRQIGRRYFLLFIAVVATILMLASFRPLLFGGTPIQQAMQGWLGTVAFLLMALIFPNLGAVYWLLGKRNWVGWQREALRQGREKELNESILGHRIRLAQIAAHSELEAELYARLADCVKSLYCHGLKEGVLSVEDHPEAQKASNAHSLTKLEYLRQSLLEYLSQNLRPFPQAHGQTGTDCRGRE